MATPLYDALVNKVRDWSNRDAETLPDSIIKDALDYAADICYRELRIPALESVVTYTIAAETDQGNILNIPGDLVEFISLRQAKSDGNEHSISEGIVYNEKVDFRTFIDECTDHRDYYRWTRRGSELVVHPNYSTDDVFELYYYGTLPALNGQYTVNVTNYSAGRLTQTNDSNDDVLYFQAGVTVPTLSDIPSLTATGSYTEPFYFQGLEVTHFLRDQQEKVLIAGALSFVADYLDNTEMNVKYTQRFSSEIQRLNNEEVMRKNSGGNVSINFRSGLI